jgi:hypothetical protein
MPRVLWTLAALAFAVLTAEAVARQIQYAPRVVDPDIGFVVPAGGVTRWAVEGNGTGHYGRDGVRSGGDRGNGPSVIVVGDSFTEALHEDDEDTFVARAAADVERNGVALRLLNLGIAGQRTPMYAEHASVYLRRYAPVWSVVVLNDEDLTADMFVQNGTYFSGGKDAGPLVLHPVPVQGAGVSARWRRAKTESALLQRTAIQSAGFLGEMRQTRLFRGGTTVQARATETDASQFPIGEALDTLFKAYDGRLTVVFLSRYAEDASAPPSPVEDVVAQHCRIAARSCVHLHTEFASFRGVGSAPYGHPNNGFNVGHLNALGHAAVGRVLARELLRLHGNGLF